ncbi:hypothetical protein K9857_14695 [Pseudomonas sp. REP124]|uniref:hypothetical protein n=1 Tax=Pseudomonas sp. REP124 TaxID=2875731 RepID=UPI001CCE4B38|nr:hypothetical protein [Pseudomonas sp. REP124]MBZ9782790.1 hypothetical protein [Pseudomonas sp. REP124]
MDAFPPLSLKGTRELRDQTRTMVAKHINPRIERKQKLNAIKMAGDNTFVSALEKSAQERHHSSWLKFEQMSETVLWF